MALCTTLSPLTHPLVHVCLNCDQTGFHLFFCTWTFKKYFCHPCLCGSPLVVVHVSASPVTRLVSTCRSLLMDRSAPPSQRPLSDGSVQNIFEHIRFAWLAKGVIMIFFSPILEMVIICQSCKKSKTFPFFCHISFWTESHCGSQLLHPFQCPRSKALSCHLSNSSFWAEAVLMGQPSQYLKHGSPISFKRHLIIHNGEKPNKWNQPRSKALSFHLSNSSFWSKSVLVAPRGGPR